MNDEQKNIISLKLRNYYVKIKKQSYNQKIE